jgi:amidase
MLSVMAGPDARVPISIEESPSAFADPDSDVRGWRIAWSRDLDRMLAVEPEIGAAVEMASRRFADLGCSVEETAPDWRDALEIIGPLRAHRTAVVFDELRPRKDEIGNPFLREFIAKAGELSLLEVGHAEARRSRLWERTAGFFSTHRLLLLPTTQWPAFPKDQDFPPTVAGRRMSGVVEAILSTYAVTIAGLPALSVPLGLTRTGLPIGLQIVGGWHREIDVLRAGIAFEDAFPPTRWAPPLSPST